MSPSDIIVPDSALPWLRLHRTDCESTSDYAKSVYHDYKGLIPHLPKDVKTILDIGCGLAGIDAYLATHYYPDAKISLLDGDGPVENFRGGFESVMVPFNSRSVTEELLAANGVTVDKWYDVGHKEPLKADLVISLLSWGWHYPLDTYTVVGDTVICDLREPKGQILSNIIYKGRQKGFRCKI